ncbi:hypothetical protein OU798_02670 [Prolixibacteraceae bacterium Z1-6]|uniref:Uncharacterized protein n=1 Tax=Draconibacterium aestuarii TaxID=2998507 RepID=A0A9X3F296_9BACT|nr:hypothetical protein [Prolixibacteraceae bacterium Z1-6]
MEKKKNIKIEFDLLENGLDFIDNALHAIISTEEPHKLKYAILHISAGIELILKEILRLEHWSLLFENINNANYNHLQSGDFQSVSFPSIIKRLEGITNGNISENQKKHFNIVRKKRNKIEHFSFKESSNALKSTISKALTDIIEIIDENIEIQNTSDESKRLYKSIRRESSKFIEFVDLVRAKLKHDLKTLEERNIKLIDCPECFQHLFPLDGSYTCLFCGYTDTPENITALYADTILDYNSYYAYKNGEECPIKQCLSCKNETLILHENSAFCITCDSNWEIEDLALCSDCDEFYEKPEDERSDYGVCPDCWQNKLDSYD